MKLVKYLIISSLFILPIIGFAAVAPLGFGGLATVSFPCTCPPGGMYIWFTPLYPNPPFPLTGPLWFPIGAILYPHFFIGVPGAWHLGQYSPGGVCMMAGPTGCFPIPTLGTILRTGTSYPGF